MSGVSLLPDQVYGEEDKTAFKRSRASGHSYEDDEEFATSASFSPTSTSSGCLLDSDLDDDLSYTSSQRRQRSRRRRRLRGKSAGGGYEDKDDQYGKEMRMLLKNLDDALDNDDLVAEAEWKRRTDKRFQSGQSSSSFIRPDFFCQYPRLLAAVTDSKRTLRSSARSSSVDRISGLMTAASTGFVMPLHRAAGGETGRARQRRIRQQPNANLERKLAAAVRKQRGFPEKGRQLVTTKLRSENVAKIPQKSARIAPNSGRNINVCKVNCSLSFCNADSSEPFINVH
jgi:hypothetical protein